MNVDIREVAAPRRVEARRQAWSWSRFRTAAVPYLYLVPMVALVGIFLLYPAADTIWLSFTKWNGIHSPQFIGLDNYTSWATDPAFGTAVVNTLYWVAGILVVQVGLGLLAAVVINASP